MSKLITLDNLKTALTKFKANLSPSLTKLDSITGVVTADKLHNPDHPTDLVAYEAFQAAVPLVQSMNLTGAQVGQTIKVKAVNEQGMPTAWEAVDMAGGEHWEKISDVSLTQDVSSYILASFGSYRKIKIIMERGTYVSGLSKNVWVRIFSPGVSNAFYTVGYLTFEYGYLKWEANAEVNNAFISGHIIASNNPNASANLNWKVSKELGDTAVSDLSLRLNFTDVSVIQDGDSVSVWGVRW